jgi:hypothetical protein
MVSTGLAVAAISSGSAHAATITGSFTDLQGDFVSWSATVDPGITLSMQICCTLPKNQGDDTIRNLVNSTFGTSFTENVGKQGLSGFSVNWAGPSADIFALHFGGKGGGNEILLALSGDTSVFNFSMTGAQNGLSSIQGFGVGGVSQTPLPAALPLFATGLGGMGLFAWARRKWKRTAATAAT